MLKKAIKFIGLILVVLFITGIMVNQIQIAMASRATLQRQSSGQEALSEPISNTSENEVDNAPVSDILENVDAHNIEQAPIDTTLESSEIKEDPPLQDFLTLTKQYEAQILQPGWVHYVSQVDRDSDNPSDPLPNGLVIPEDILMDTWMLLDEEGFIIQAIDQMVTLDGQVIQTSILENGVWTNLTLGDWIGEEVQEAPSRFDLSINFAQKIERAMRDGDLITVKVVGDDTLFVLTHVFEEPIQIEDIKSSPVIRSEITIYVDTKTGEVKLYELVFALEDGTFRTTLRQFPILVESGLALPAELTQYFGK